MLIRPLKLILYTILTILSISLSYTIYNYVTCPVYTFAEPVPFAGEHIYNPYKGINGKKLIKVNLHAHTTAYGGLTFGENSANELVEIYSRYDYDISAISNYQSISDYNKESESYIPVYEHGYNAFKFHQLNIGAKSISWRDYPFFMTISNKQHLIDCLRHNSELIAICHPKFTRLLSRYDMQRLSNYNLIEVVSGMAHSVSYWDAALSAGRLSFAIGNDDSHDMNNIYDYAKACTIIYVDTLSATNVYESLNSGAAFAVEIPMVSDSMQRMELSNRVLKEIKDINFRQDTISIRLDDIASKINFIGQNGEIKKSLRDTNNAQYHFKPSDTYIRVEVEFGDLKYFSNPFLRYDKSIDDYRNVNKIDYQKSIIYWTLYFVVILILGYFAFKILRRKYRRRQIRKRWYND